MPEVTSHKPGSFCWFELATTDQNAAKKFYSNLFGWEIKDEPMGPDAYYTMLQKNGKNVGALFQMDANMQSSGFPPHWNTYISVENVESAEKRATELGATVMMPTMDVMDHGRMAVIQDPTGAPVSLWEPKGHKGADVVGEPNAFCWFELNTNDTDKAKNFYTGLLGWKTGGSPEYTEWKQGEQSIGGMMKIQPEWGNVPPNWTNYVMVENVDQSAKRASELGGSLMTGPMDIPGTGRFAIIQDPQGAVLALFQPS